MDQSLFDKYYSKLNSAQKTAVDSVDGPVMVVAGPGTGKTQILTLRIANILKQTDTEPRSILALTFTESGVASMRRRLAEIIGTPAYSVAINTFHGFCNDIIKNHPEKFPRIIGSESITEADQLKIIESIIESAPLKILRPFGDPLLYVKDVLSALNDAKREGVSPKGLTAIVKKEKEAIESAPDLYREKGAHKGRVRGEYVRALADLEKNTEFAKVYQLYEKKLASSKFYDYADMLVEALHALESDKDLLLTLQEEYQYVLVDEHQDTNNVQNRIIELLCNFHKNPNVFVVGDEKQAIFRFQGASLENFYYFKSLYPKAKIIILEENYRSTQTILNSAHSVLAGEKPLHAKAGHTENKVKIYPFLRRDAADYFLANDIKRLINGGVSPGEIAIIYRENRDASPISAAFEKAGIPYVVESEENILHDSEIRKLIMLLNAVAHFGEPGSFIEAMHIDFLGIMPLDTYKLARASYDRKANILDLARSTRILSELGLESPEKITDFYRKLSSWASLSRNRGLAEFFEILVNESGCLKHILSLADPFGKMDKLNAVFDAVKSLAERNKRADLRDLMDYFDILERHGRSLGKSVVHRVPNKVRLMTAHRSKGQEFEYVYIVNCVYGHWGDKRRPERIKLPDAVYSLTGKAFKDKADDGDERRLFYVALTRAKKSVSIIYSKDAASKGEALPSRFVEEINSEFVEKVDTEPYEKEFDSRRETVFAPRRAVGPGLKDKEFVRELFLKKGLSVTELNNYLKCPWRYFYVNLIRVPKAPEKPQMYGIAVHAALNDLLSGRGGKPKKEYLLRQFQNYLKEQPLGEVEYDELLEKGRKSLTGYFEENKNKWEGVLKTEFNVSGILLTPEIKLTGKIDRIDKAGDQNEVVVIDYKTSQPRTKNEIEGRTKNSDGDIKRQLVFYNLLLNKLDNPKFKMVRGDIDFVEPDQKGRYKRESFVIAPGEIAVLEDLVKEKSTEILSLSFWDKGRCDDKDCEWCELREAMC